VVVSGSKSASEVSVGVSIGLNPAVPICSEVRLRLGIGVSPFCQDFLYLASVSTLAPCGIHQAYAVKGDTNLGIPSGERAKREWHSNRLYHKGFTAPRMRQLLPRPIVLC
jgi:hypothetical protein